MISAATFNYYQELVREIKDFSTEDLQTAVETGKPKSVREVFDEYLHVPWGVLTTDSE
jgi:predicted Ser/Thr protein kinase